MFQMGQWQGYWIQCFRIIIQEIMSENNQTYKAYISCLGSICGFCCCTYTRVQTSTVGMIQNFGKFKNLLQPGLHYYNPFTQNIKTIEMKTKVIDMPNQIVYTKDNISVDIDTAIFYRVIDAFRATYRVKDLARSLAEMTFVTMRTICGEYVLQDLLIKRIQVNQKIAQYVQKSSQSWGIHVEQIVLKDMRMSSLLSNNLSTVSKTKRDVQSQIISAKADLQCAQLYRQASDILQIKAAVQIRFLQTLQNMNSMPSKKVTIIPLRQEFDEFK